MTIQTETRKIPPITLSTRLRLAREWRGLDQQQIADELGISRATVSNYETAKTDPGKMAINAWAVTCDVEVDWLRTGIEPQAGGPGGGAAGNDSGKLQIHNLRYIGIAARAAADAAYELEPAA